MQYGHYTTANALISIILNEQLWATNIKFLNDEQEFLHAIVLAKEVIKSSTEKADKFKANRSAYDDFTKEVTKALDNLDTYHAESIFTCSFSEEKDLLSQWRGYCPNNQGYCIHFDLAGLLKAAKEKFTSCEIFPCVYDNTEKKKRISAALNDHWKKFITLTDSKKREQEIRVLAYEIERLASYFKHPSFAEEKEHRLVIRLAWDIEEHARFRAGPMSIIPFLEVPAPKALIKEIGIGPTRDQTLARRGLAALIEFKFGTLASFGDVKLSESKIPYRL